MVFNEVESIVGNILEESFYVMILNCGKICLGVENVSFFLVVIVGVEG